MQPDTKVRGPASQAAAGVGDARGDVLDASAEAQPSTQHTDLNAAGSQAASAPLLQAPDAAVSPRTEAPTSATESCSEISCAADAAGVGARPADAARTAPDSADAADLALASNGSIDTEALAQPATGAALASPAASTEAAAPCGEPDAASASPSSNVQQSGTATGLQQEDAAADVPPDGNRGAQAGREGPSEVDAGMQQRQAALQLGQVSDASGQAGNASGQAGNASEQRPAERAHMTCKQAFAAIQYATGRCYQEHSRLDEQLLQLQHCLACARLQHSADQPQCNALSLCPADTCACGATCAKSLELQWASIST